MASLTSRDKLVQSEDDSSLTTKKENFRMWNEVDQYDESHVVRQSIVMRSLDMVTGKVDESEGILLLYRSLIMICFQQIWKLPTFTWKSL